MSKSRIKVEEVGEDNIEVTCKICGKPIVKSNKFGMYCENSCGKEADKEAYIKIKNMFGGIL